MRLLSLSIAAVASIALAVGPISSVSAAASECFDYVIIGARGTGAPSDELNGLGNVSSQSAVKLRDILRHAGKTVDLVGLDYPAEGTRNFVLQQNGRDYQLSLAAGAQETERVLTSLRRDCPSAKAVVIGFSQGGQTIGKGIGSLTASASDIVAGAITFGDPVFNNLDRATRFGSFDRTRGGLFGIRTEWAVDIDGPVVAVCHKGDPLCQGREHQLVNGRIQQRLDLSGFGLNPMKEHGNYHEVGDTVRAACELAARMGYSHSTCRGGASRIERQSYVPNGDGVDVALLIDTSGSSSGVLAALQDRADDVIHQTSHDAPGTRYAVIGYSRGNVVDATGGFTTNAAEAVAAIRSLEVSSGQHAAIYSAITEANSLDWRENSRQVTLTLSTSRACASQYCGTEAATGVGFVGLRYGSDTRRAGVYTRQQEFFFESAGWSQAMDERFTSRPGQLRSDEGWIDELQRVFGEAVTEENYVSIAGTVDTVAGQIGEFSADDVIPFYADSPGRRLVWSVERTGDVAPAPGGGGEPTASRSTSIQITDGETFEGAETPDGDELRVETDPGGPDGIDDPEGAETDSDEEFSEEDEGENENAEPGLPEDQGPLFDTAFALSGMYEVTLTAYLDGTVQTFQHMVRVRDLPTEAPAAPLVFSMVVDDIQMLRWTEGEGEPATAYGLMASDGTVNEIFVPQIVRDPDGISRAQVEIALEGGDPYRLVAYNEVAETPAIGLVTATGATYTHVAAEAGTPTGGELELRGEVSVELASATSGASTGEISLTGNYEAQFVTINGESFAIDMSNVDAGLTMGEIWSARFSLRDAVTVDGLSLSELLDDGLAEEILVGGHVDLQVEGNPIRVKIAPTADVAELDEFIIDSDTPPPAGTPATDIAIDHQEQTLSLGDSFDPQRLQFIAEAVDPLQDWTAVTISDIRTWIGSTEVSNTLVGTSIQVSGDGVPNSANLDFAGTVVGGTPTLVRDFLSEGTISFIVDGYQPTVMTLGFSSDDAFALYPDLDPPKLIGRNGIPFVQYRDGMRWKPVVDWGSSWTWDRKVYLDGALPEGLSWDSWNAELSGTAASSGSYPLTLTAISGAGQSTKSYTLVVNASNEPSAIVTGEGYSWTDGDGTDYFDLYAYEYFRPDNPAVASSLPIVHQFVEHGFLSATIANATIVNSAGQPLPIAGDFVIQMWRQTGWLDQLWIGAYGLHRTDGVAGTSAELLAEADRIIFLDERGGENTIALRLIHSG